MGKEEEEGVREETEQVHGHGIEQHMSTTSFANCLLLLMLVVPIAMVLCNELASCLKKGDA